VDELGRPDPELSDERTLARIVNGTTTTDYPSVGALALLNAANHPILNCSGTLIGCSTFLTAAHCVCAEGASDAASCLPAGLDDAARLVVFFQHGGFYKVASVTISPDYSLQARGDVAVVKLANPVTGIAPSRINTLRSPADGTTGTIVGFGGYGSSSNRPNPGSGMKRRGKVVTGRCVNDPPNSTHVCWSLTNPVGPPGEDSGTCYGDSGGPLFVDFGSGPTVAAVTSLVTAECEAPSTFRDTDVFVYRSWIQLQGGADLQNTTCGTISQVGADGTSVTTTTGQLDVFDRSGPLMFQVPAGTSLLRVALNGAVVGLAPNVANDFRLYLKQGRPPGEGDFDCDGSTGTAFGFCAVCAPVPGTWYADAEWHLGLGGTYQLTASLFEGAVAPTPTPTPVVALPCAGDCNQNHVVEVNELLIMLNVALDKLLPASCLAGDTNQDGRITVDELVAAVNRAMRGCPLT
jgi:hypothetical protein